MAELPDFVEIHEELAAWVRSASRADIEPLDEEHLGQWAEVVERWRQQEKIRLLETGLAIHYTYDVKEDVRTAIETALDRGDPDDAPHDLWDGERRSDCEGYDEFVRFALRRDADHEPWTGTRFEPRTLFELLEPYSHGVKVLALAEPLQGYESN